MATVLARQLAQLRSQSTNPLDLKAQKKAHSKSLLYDPQVAGNQEFDTIYQLCYDGFEDLCRLDSRFLAFAGTLFSEQSKSQDRTQMTLAQNKELDVVVEDFICLSSRRLALKPALKAVEWIIRRFRVHEDNTLILVLAFLPYHDTPIFTTLLSLLPPKLPQQIKFLHPYTQSLANPTRHTIVYSASNSKPFLAALSSFVLKCCEGENQSPALVSFWASTTAEAVMTMLDQAKSARRESQMQNEEDTLIFLLPIINAAFAIKNAPELRVGCYMILSVLATKTRLEDSVLTAMMEAVVLDWQPDSREGLVCLAVIAENRVQHKLPRKVLKAILSFSSLQQDLLTLHQHYQVSKLALGILTGMLRATEKNAEAERLNQIENIMDTSILDEASLSTAISSLLSTVAKFYAKEEKNRDMRGHLTDLVIRLSQSRQIGNQVRRAVNESRLELGHLSSTLEILTNDTETKALTSGNEDHMEIDESEVIRDFDTIANYTNAESAMEMSFLSNPEPLLYNDLGELFCSMPINTANLARFSDLPLLRKDLAMTAPPFLSFYIRLWCSASSFGARAAALRSVAVYLRDSTISSDVQILFPYLVYALSDASSLVRSTAADIVQILRPLYVKTANTMDSHLKKSSIYGANVQSTGVSTGVDWLSPKAGRRFLDDLLGPHLEECLLDKNTVLYLLPSVLKGHQTSEETGKIHTDLKKPARLSIFSFLCSHTVASSLYDFKLRMLQILNKIEKISSVPRTSLLLPILFEVRNAGLKKLEKDCQMEAINPLELVSEVMNIVTAASEEGILALRQIAESESFELLQSASFQRIRSLWPRLSAETQISLTDSFLDLAVRRRSDGRTSNQQGGAIETLRSVRLTAPIQQHLLNGLPSVTSRLEAPPAKRRRTDDGNMDVDETSSGQSLADDVRRITFVLELIDAAKAEQNVALLPGLFQLLSDLKDAKGQASTALGYLQVLTMDCMLSVLTKSKTTSTSESVDAATIRVDVLIDYIRATESPQIRNAALLLVAKLSDIAPERVLHSIMPIFMYMGANVLRQEDEFSVYVVQQTMDSVIPRLVQSLNRYPKKAFAGVSELLVNFAAAFEHIPQRRRLGIFVALVDKVGLEDYLYALCVILSDKYPGNKKALQLSLDLFAQTTFVIQLPTIKKYLKVVLDVWEKPKAAGRPSAVLLDQTRSAETATLSLLPLSVSIFESTPIKAKIRKALKDEDEASEVEGDIAAILGVIFELSQYCRDNGRLNSLCMKVMDSFLQILPSSELIRTLEDLLEHASTDLQKQILQSFGHHLSMPKNDDKAARESCLAFVPRLLNIISYSIDPLVKRLAVSAIDQISEKYGKVDSATVIEAAKIIIGDICLDEGDADLRAASLLCLSTMIEVSGEAIVPIVPLMLPKVFKNLDSSIEKESQDANVHNACYSIALTLLIYIPWIIADADLDHLLTLSHKSAIAEMGDDCEETRTEALQTIAGQIGTKELLAALIRTWPSAVSNGPPAVLEHIQILHLAIERQPKSVLMQQTELLGDLLLHIFSLHQTQSTSSTEPGYTETTISEAESLTTRTALAMISKLNDTTFRPLFQRLHTWSTTPELTHPGRLQRQMTWYTFLPRFFDHFKSIVTSYTALILPDLLTTLSTTPPISTLLLGKLLETIRTTCTHDQDNFHSNPSTFTSLTTALTALLPLPDLSSHLTPTLATLAAATSSPVQHKALNAALLTYLRSPTASVRLAAVKVQRAILTTDVGEEWVAECLPEMLPVVAEVVEDEDEEVEKEGGLWVQGLEEVVGESLQGMLS